MKCFFCDQPGSFCAVCSTYLCPDHKNNYPLRAKAAFENFINEIGL
jgi:hypothetical protein